MELLALGDNLSEVTDDAARYAPVLTIRRVPKNTLSHTNWGAVGSSCVMVVLRNLAQAIEIRDGVVQNHRPESLCTDTCGNRFTLERPAFEKLQKDIFSGNVGMVVMWKLDRLSRQAFGELESEGLITQRRGLGMFVTNRATRAAKTQSRSTALTALKIALTQCEAAQVSREEVIAVVVDRMPAASDDEASI